jgi:hypothetical protein
MNLIRANDGLPVISAQDEPKLYSMSLRVVRQLAEPASARPETLARDGTKMRYVRQVRQERSGTTKHFV